MSQPTTPVMFSLPGLNSNVDSNNSGFNSPPEESKKDMAAYKIPPVFWMVAMLIGGYLIVRYSLDEA